MTRNLGGIVELQSGLSILGDFATLYLMGVVALVVTGVLLLVITRRRRYARMIAVSPVWPAAVAYLLLRPPTVR